MTAAKALVAIVISAVGALVVALGTGSDSTISDLTTKSWLVAILAVLGSGGVVYFCQNTSAAPIIKAVVGFLSAGLASLVVALNDNHITQAEYLVAFSAAVGGLGFVYQVTNRA